MNFIVGWFARSSSSLWSVGPFVTFWEWVSDSYFPTTLRESYKIVNNGTFLLRMSRSFLHFIRYWKSLNPAWIVEIMTAGQPGSVTRSFITVILIQKGLLPSQPPFRWPSNPLKWLPLGIYLYVSSHSKTINQVLNSCKIVYCSLPWDAVCPGIDFCASSTM